MLRQPSLTFERILQGLYTAHYSCRKKIKKGVCILCLSVVKKKKKCGWTVEANVNRVLNENGEHYSQQKPDDPLCGVHRTIYFLYIFSVSTIKDLVERRGLSHGVKAVRPYDEACGVLAQFMLYSGCFSPQHAGWSTVSEGSNAGLVNLRGIPPIATHPHVIGDRVRLAATLIWLSEY